MAVAGPAPNAISAASVRAVPILAMLSLRLVFVTCTGCLGRRGLGLIAWRRCTREHVVDRRRAGAHRHASVPVTPLVKVGVPVVRLMAAMQVDRQDLQDRRALGLERREKIGAHENVI